VNEPSPDGVRLLQPQQIAASVRRLVEESREFLLLICPYYRPWPQMQGEIEKAARRHGEVRLVVREDAVGEARKHLAPCHACGVQVLSVMKLHAKLYVTESAAILTSMNLVDASAQESWEAGILVESDAAPGLYGRIRQQAENFIDAAEAVESPDAQKRARQAAPAAEQDTRTKGSCVRCAKAIRLDPEKPFCFPCYGKWKKYNNSEYVEKHCHRCGKAAETSAAKPLCRACYANSNR